MIKIENVRLNYASMTEPVLDKLSNKEVYKVRIDVPFTQKVYDAIMNEIDDTKQYAMENKLSALEKNGRIPEPYHVYDLDQNMSDDGKWIYLNLHVSKPITVFDRFGNKLESCPIKRCNHADVQIFAYAWTHGNRWGVKLCPKAVCIKEDINAIMSQQIDPNGKSAGCEFIFDAKEVISSENPFV